MTVQQTIVRAMMRLPAPVLRAMSKKAVTTVDGRELDPGMGLLAAQTAGAPPMDTLTPEEARAGARDGFTLMNAPRMKGAGVTEMTIPGPGGSLAVRHYWPASQEGSGALMVYFHMGGCVIGDLDTCDHFCSRIAARTGAGVLSVDYRLAPEHRYPAAVEDALAAFRWARDNAARLNADPAHISVGGDSAGGYLATIVAQEMKRKGEQGPSLQLLIYPWTDMTATGGSMESCAECAPLNTETMRYFEKQYMPDGADKSAPDASPGLVDDLAGLPRSFVYTAGFDPLRDQGETYARKLEAAGVDVRFREYADLPHAFTAMAGVSKRAAQAADEIIADIAEALAK